MALYLILDDQTQYCRSLARALHDVGEATTAHSVAQAKALITGECAFALVDIRLDESNAMNKEGIEFIRWARAQFPSLPIIAMSALENPLLQEEALQAGASRFLRKPILISQLKTLLKGMLSKEK